MIPLNKYMYTAAIVVSAGVAHAQPAVQQPVEYTIKLTAAEVDIVGKGLGLLPYQDVALIIQKLRQQIVEQQSVSPKTMDKKE